MKKTALIALLLGLGLMASAQEFTFYGEFVRPQGRYFAGPMTKKGTTRYPRTAVTDTANNYGGANYGWGAGFQVALPVATQGLDILVDAAFRMNWPGKSIKTYFDNYAATHNTKGISRPPYFYNIPLLVGPRITITPFEGLSLFASVTAGFNVRIITDAIFSYNLVYDYRTTCTPGVRLAAGILISDHLRLEANWNWLGNEPVLVEIYKNGHFCPEQVFGTLQTTQVAARIGWTF